MPTFLRVMTSSVVYSSRSLAMPQNSMSLLAKGPTGMNGASSPVLGVMVCCRMVAWDNNLWEEVWRELHAPRDEQVHLCACIHHVHMLWTVPHEQMMHH